LLALGCCYCVADHEHEYAQAGTSENMHPEHRLFQVSIQKVTKQPKIQIEKIWFVKAETKDFALIFSAFNDLQSGSKRRDKISRTSKTSIASTRLFTKNVQMTWVHQTACGSPFR
jgi:hypothetical protein